MLVAIQVRIFSSGSVASSFLISRRATGTATEVTDTNEKITAETICDVGATVLRRRFIAAAMAHDMSMGLRTNSAKPSTPDRIGWKCSTDCSIFGS